MAQELFRFCNRTFVETLRVAKSRIYMFVLKRCAGEDICPVVGLYAFMSGCRNLDVDLSLAIS